MEPRFACEALCLPSYKSQAPAAAVGGDTRQRLRVCMQYVAPMYQGDATRRALAGIDRSFQRRLLTANHDYRFALRIGRCLRLVMHLRAFKDCQTR